jgi:glyoxylase-like metal-dependent hydrolase (beta-lactamase superfamily II)
VPTLPRQIAPAVHWLGACGVSNRYGGVIHIHKSNYLVVGGDATLLVDTGVPPNWPQLEKQLDGILKDRPLDWVFATHPEPAHASNVPLLLDKYPAARMVGDVRDLHLYFPSYQDRFVRRSAGDEVELGGGVTVVFLAPAFWDLPATLWAYEVSGQVLFVADGFAYAHHSDPDGSEDAYHLEGECALTSGELPGPIAPEQMAFVLKAALYWSRYVDVAPFFERLESILERYPPHVVAPAHGNVVVNLDDVMPVMREAYALAYDG